MNKEISRLGLIAVLGRHIGNLSDSMTGCTINADCSAHLVATKAEGYYTWSKNCWRRPRKTSNCVDIADIMYELKEGYQGELANSACPPGNVGTTNPHRGMLTKKEGLE